MNNTELLKAIETLLIQGQNNYHLSSTDLEKAEQALTVLNNIYKTAKDLK